ncbi:MAG: SCO family protein [Anaerolineae bacterium]
MIVLLLGLLLVAAACSPAGQGGAQVISTASPVPPTAAAAVPSATPVPPSPIPPTAAPPTLAPPTAASPVAQVIPVVSTTRAQDTGLPTSAATSAADNSKVTAVAALLSTQAATRATPGNGPTHTPTMPPPTSAAVTGPDESQTTAVAGRLAQIAATRAAQSIAPTVPPTRPADATQSVAAIATAFGYEAAAASEGVSLGTVVNPPLLVRNFTLPASTGADLSIYDLNGKYRMIFFGYLHCPDFCPLTMAEFKRVKQLLGEYADQVDFIYISVDGARDTPELIASYLNNFDPTFIGFQGNDTTLAQIQPDYGFYYQRRLDTGSQAEYVVDHSTRSYLLDREGRLRSSFTYDTEPEVIADALRWYIQNE